MNNDTTKKLLGIDRSAAKSNLNHRKPMIPNAIFYPLFVAIILAILFLTNQ